MIGLIVILAGLVSVVVGGAVTRRSVQRALGTIDRDSMMSAQVRGVIPRFAPIAVVAGLLAVLIGIVLVIIV